MGNKMKYQPYIDIYVQYELSEKKIYRALPHLKNINQPVPFTSFKQKMIFFILIDCDNVYIIYYYLLAD